jgi:hypothetical protein
MACQKIAVGCCAERRRPRLPVGDLSDELPIAAWLRDHPHLMLVGRRELSVAEREASGLRQRELPLSNAAAKPRHLRERELALAQSRRFAFSPASSALE